MKDCINPVAYGQCISLTKGKCLHKGFCEPIDQEGNRYTMVPFKENGKTICYIRSTYLPPIAPIDNTQPAEIILMCEHCGKGYSVYPSRVGKRRYCSNECRDAAIRGKPNPDRALSYKGRFKGADNPNFKGDNVSYDGIHHWVYRNIPKPTYCQRCNKLPESGRIEAHNISGEYKRDPSDWIYVCTACHQELDGRRAALIENALKHRDNLGRLTVGCSEIIDAEREQKKALVAIIKEQKRPISDFRKPIITEEPVPSPHPFLDPYAIRYRTIKKVFGECPATENCTISGEPTAPRRCKVLQKALP